VCEYWVTRVHYLQSSSKIHKCTKSRYWAHCFRITRIIMAENTSSAASNTIPFPTLTILYLPAEAESIIDEVSQKYFNITVEECNGFFHGGLKRKYNKVTIWSQGIDSLWFNAIIARTKELAGVDFVPIVSGGIMYSV